MKQISFLAIIILVLAACDSTPKFTVAGEITGAEGKTLYIEASQLEGIAVLDSVKLKADGSYKFGQPQPANPEFYRLRIENKVINFSVEPTDESLTINAPYTEFATAYTVEGSLNSAQIKELVLTQIKLQSNLNALVKSVREGRMKADLLQDSIQALLNAHKERAKQEYIYTAPNTTPAYFALFQKVNDFFIFDPLVNKEDLRCFQAVATSMVAFYPNSARTKNMENLTLKGLRNNREPKETAPFEIPEDLIVETGVIDIVLKDIKGKTHRLTDLKGKVVLLDFTVYQSTMSTPHNFLLNDLYEKYAAKGLEIYQVSFDPDEHFWKTVAGNLPWICVRDLNGVYSSIAKLYNIQNLPAYFLVNKNNELSARGENIKDLDAAIKALL